MSHTVTLSITERRRNNLLPAPHGVRYHQQDTHGGTELYCGPACAQMLLMSVGAGLIDQQTLFTSAKAVSAPDPIPDWHTAPDGLTIVLNHRKPATFTDDFFLWALDSEEAISRKICWAIQRGVAPIALIQGGEHWIVVVGFTADAAPTSSTDTGYTIESFDIFDPYPPTPDHRDVPAAPPPHTDGTDDCGTGSASGFDLGDETITIDYEGAGMWRDAYMLSIQEGNWSGKYMAICDIDPPANIALLAAPGDATPQRGEIERDPNVIRRRATARIAARAQADQAGRGAADSGAPAGDPLLVERDDLNPPQFYYLVPFTRDDGVVPLVATVDAYQGGSGAGFIASPGGTHFSRASNRQSDADAGRAALGGRQGGGALRVDEVVGHVVDVEVDGVNVKVPLKAEDLHANLVWRPCAESLSPYRPFYRFNARLPNDRPITIYVRIDGAVFTELHQGMGM